MKPNNFDIFAGIAAQNSSQDDDLDFFNTKPSQPQKPKANKTGALFDDDDVFEAIAGKTQKSILVQVP
jgi:hypothetical protein